MFIFWCILYLIGAVAGAFLTYSLGAITLLSLMASDKGYMTIRDWILTGLLGLGTLLFGAGTAGFVFLAIRSLL